MNIISISKPKMQDPKFMKQMSKKIAISKLAVYWTDLIFRGKGKQ